MKYFVIQKRYESYCRLCDAGVQFGSGKGNDNGDRLSSKSSLAQALPTRAASGVSGAENLGNPEVTKEGRRTQQAGESTELSEIAIHEESDH